MVQQDHDDGSVFALDGKEPLRVDSHFRVSISSSRPDAHVVTVSGELDLSTAPKLEAALQTASGRIVIDCQDLQFIDAAGITVLVKALRHVDSIQLVNPAPSVRKTITIVGMDGLLLEKNGPDTQRRLAPRGCPAGEELSTTPGSS